MLCCKHIIVYFSVMHGKNLPPGLGPPSGNYSNPVSPTNTVQWDIAVVAHVVERESEKFEVASASLAHGT